MDELWSGTTFKAVEKYFLLNYEEVKIGKWYVYNKEERNFIFKKF